MEQTLRRSERILKRPQLQYEIEPNRPKKRRCVGTRKVGARVIVEIHNMPVEIFLKIISFVLPQDLLQLSRTSHAIRSILMSNRSALIWRQSMNNLPTPLPECPDGLLNEPQCVALVFENYCQSCWRKCNRRAIYTILKRLCDDCICESTSNGTRILEDSTAPRRTSSKVLVMIPALNASLAEMRSWAYLTDLSTKTSFNYEEMAKLSHRFQKQMYIDVYNKFNSFNDRSPEQSAYTLERVEIVNRYYKFAISMFDWHVKEGERLEAVRRKRQGEWKEAVMIRLQKQGYSERDLDFSDYLDPELSHKWFKLTLQNHVLTEKRWNYIVPELEAAILENRDNIKTEAIRIRRIFLYELFQVRYQPYYDQCDEEIREAVPRHIAGLSCPMLEEYVNDNMDNLALSSIDDVVWADLLEEAVKPAMLEFKNEVGEYLDKKYRDKVYGYYQKQEDGKVPVVPDADDWKENKFQLPDCPLQPSSFIHTHAASFFCGNKPSGYRLPMREIKKWVEELCENPPREFADGRTILNYALSTSVVSCDKPMFKTAMKLLHSLGYLEESMDNMVGKGHNFVCVPCTKRKKHKTARYFTWNQLVYHYWYASTCIDTTIRKRTEHVLSKGEKLVIERDGTFEKDWWKKL